MGRKLQNVEQFVNRVLGGSGGLWQVCDEKMDSVIEAREPSAFGAGYKPRPDRQAPGPSGPG